MKAQDIDNFLARWQATLSPAFAPAYVDGYFRRHRAEIEAIVVRALAERAARRGERPEDAADFLAYDAVVAAQRLLDGRPDPQVVKQLMRNVDAQFSEGYAEWAVYGNFAVELRKVDGHGRYRKPTPARRSAALSQTTASPASPPPWPGRSPEPVARRARRGEGHRG